MGASGRMWKSDWKRVVMAWGAGSLVSGCGWWFSRVLSYNGVVLPHVLQFPLTEVGGKLSCFTLT